jgi:hypothetical protein
MIYLPTKIHSGSLVIGIMTKAKEHCGMSPEIRNSLIRRDIRY